MRGAYEQRYLPNEGVWLLSAPEVPFEIIVGGNSSSPSQPRMELLNKVSLHIAALSHRAQAYLDEFVDRRKFAQGTAWFFEGLEIGRNSTDPDDELHFIFSIEGDTYGSWCVTFRQTPNGFFPVRMLRAQE